MTLSDVTSVFSRYFIIGFFLPPFFGLLLLWQTLAGPFPPNRLGYSAPANVAILGGVALLIGLLLIAYRQPLRTLLEGYVTHKLRFVQPLLLWLESRRRRDYERLRAELAEFDEAIASTREVLEQLEGVPEEQATMKKYFEGVLSRQQQQRATDAHELDRYFPYDGSVRPTRFGNAVRAWQSYSFSRWWLDSYAVWPRMNLMLTAQERDRHDDAETDLAFFINSSLVTATVGALYIADWILYRHLFDLWWIATPLLTYSLYRSAVGAAVRLGDQIRSSVDIHRLEVYEKLGVVAPSGPAQEQQVGEAINDCLLRGTPIPQALRRAETTAPD